MRDLVMEYVYTVASGDTACGRERSDSVSEAATPASHACSLATPITFEL